MMSEHMIRGGHSGSPSQSADGAVPVWGLTAINMVMRFVKRE